MTRLTIYKAMTVSTRTSWVIGNWKMNPVRCADATALAAACADHAQTLQGCQMAIVPSIVHLQAVQSVSAQALMVGVQDISIYAGSGAYTGDVSVDQVVDLKARFVLVGHSERRQYHQESDATLLKKTQLAVSQGLRVVYCVGEQLADRDAGLAQSVVLDQLNVLFDHLSLDQWAHLLIAYEPVWAIGTGRTATPSDAQAMHAAIRERLKQHDASLASTAILYGGSVKPDNAQALSACDDVDGALVGGAALDAQSFLAIAQAFAGA